jgi:hypothetical protein
MISRPDAKLPEPAKKAFLGELCLKLASDTERLKVVWCDSGEAM